MILFSSFRFWGCGSMDNEHKVRASFFVLLGTGLLYLWFVLRFSFFVHVYDYLLALQPQKISIKSGGIKKYLILYWDSGNIPFQLSLRMGDINQPGVLDQAYLVTPSPLDEMLNSVNSSFFWLLASFLITYLFVPLRNICRHFTIVTFMESQRKYFVWIIVLWTGENNRFCRKNKYWKLFPKKKKKKEGK